MYRGWLLLLGCGVLSGCAAAPWSWQDTRAPARSEVDMSIDLDACRSYAASQYAPGVPAGDPYRQVQANYPDPRPLGDDSGQPPGTGTWHPDREPFPFTSYEREDRHGVITPYTGYPGYLDYHPGYLDALVEKCMADRGWDFRPTPTEKP